MIYKRPTNSHRYAHAVEYRQSRAAVTLHPYVGCCAGGLTVSGDLSCFIFLCLSFRFRQGKKNDMLDLLGFEVDLHFMGILCRKRLQSVFIHKQPWEA